MNQKKFLSAVMAMGLLFAVPLSIATFTPGCVSTQRVAYTTLYTVGQTTDAAVKAYLDLVVTKKLPATTLPKVSAAYTSFQATFNVALAAVQMNTKAVAPASVMTESSKVLAIIEQAKNGQ